MRIKVLGSRCANCKTTIKLFKTALAERGLSAELEKVEDYPSIMRYGVMGRFGLQFPPCLRHAV